MIDRFFDIYTILEKCTLATDEYGAEIKTWSISTTIFGCKQNRSGSQSIVNNIEKDRQNDRFYCGILSITENDRLLFSTNTYSFKGNSSGSSALLSTDYGALYFCNSTFSTYIYGDYARYSSVTTAYAIENFNYYKIMHVNNLIDRHLQIDIEEDNKNRI